MVSLGENEKMDKRKAIVYLALLLNIVGVVLILITPVFEVLELSIVGIGFLVIGTTVVQITMKHYLRYLEEEKVKEEL